MADVAARCSSEAQSSCCEPSQKSSCCDPAAHAELTCGCAAGAKTDVRDAVRERYAAAARSAAEGSGASCCGSSVTLTDQAGAQVFGDSLYYAEDRDQVPNEAMVISLGCGNPTAMADLKDGDVVLDLGSGGGADVLLAAGRVAPSGKVYGLDMTDEMLTLARANAAKAGVSNVDFIKGYIEGVPLPDASVDLVISNCVINLAADKSKVIAEAARVLRPGGCFAVSDVIADEDMDEATRADMQAYTGCFAGALTRREFDGLLRSAGMTDVEITETHRVHGSGSSAIIKAVKA
jgi:arsenite methyltransferase